MQTAVLQLRETELGIGAFILAEELHYQDIPVPHERLRDRKTRFMGTVEIGVLFLVHAKTMSLRVLLIPENRRSPTMYSLIALKLAVRIR